MPSMPSESEPDDYLIGRVHDALAHELKELDVHVTLAGGAVYLEGVVLTEARRDAVADVVRAHAGEKPVHNQLTVAPLDEPTRAEEIPSP